MAPWRRRLYLIIFEADTRAGRIFDLAVLILIVASVVVVCLASVAEVAEHYMPHLIAVEWVFTVLFSIEYILRLVCARRPGAYALSFFGLVDLLAVVPTYAGLFLHDEAAASLMVIRALRLLRAFRILKLGRYVGEAGILAAALRNSKPKITVFLFAVMAIVMIVGSAMYLIEGPEHGFTSIPRSMYWAIVTLTTVGYGDIVPQTVYGQALSAMVMVLGYGIIAVPTGIVTAELTSVARRPSTRLCPECMAEGHDPDARFCRHCGGRLVTDTASFSRID
ncbi:MAG: ion transporter [Planctomycetota bacterium]|jgi:voltage-gated potassium channel